MKDVKVARRDVNDIVTQPRPTPPPADQLQDLSSLMTGAGGL